MKDFRVTKNVKANNFEGVLAIQNQEKAFRDNNSQKYLRLTLDLK